MCQCSHCQETAEENSYWADVYYYMEQHQATQEMAEKAIREAYKIMEQNQEECK